MKCAYCNSNETQKKIELRNGFTTAICEDCDKLREFMAEEIVKPTRVSGIGVGVIEAPRGTLYHKVEINEQGNIVEGEIVVPTGQNQINIEQDMARLVEELLPQNPPQEKIQLELEKLIRAYDPCMSCASHFLKLNIAKVSA